MRRLLRYPSVHQRPHLAAVVVGDGLAVAEGAVVLVIPRDGGRHLGRVVEVPAGRLPSWRGAVGGVLLVAATDERDSGVVGLGGAGTGAGAGGALLAGRGVLVRVLRLLQDAVRPLRGRGGCCCCRLRRLLLAGPVHLDDLVGEVAQLRGVVQPGVLGQVVGGVQRGRGLLVGGAGPVVLAARQLREHAVVRVGVAHGDARVVRDPLGALGPPVAPNARPVAAAALHAAQAGGGAEGTAPAGARQALHGVLGREARAVGLRDAVDHVQLAQGLLQAGPVGAAVARQPVNHDGVSAASAAVQHGHRTQRIHGSLAAAAERGGGG